MVATPKSGYWMLGSDGHVYAFGSAANFGSAAAPAVAFSARRDGTGYWVVDAAGDVRALRHGGVPRRDSRAAGGRARLDDLEHADRQRLLAVHDARPRVRLRRRALLRRPARACTSTGRSSRRSRRRPVTATTWSAPTAACSASATPASTVRWAAAHLNQPIVGLSPTPDNRGYWLVASDGGVFAFGAPFRGSLGSTRAEQARERSRRVRQRLPDGRVRRRRLRLLRPAFVGSLGSHPPPPPSSASPPPPRSNQLGIGARPVPRAGFTPNCWEWGGFHGPVLLPTFRGRRAVTTRSASARCSDAARRVDSRGDRDRRRPHRPARPRDARRAARVGGRGRGVAERFARVGPLRRAHRGRPAHLPHRERVGVSPGDRGARRGTAAGLRGRRDRRAGHRVQGQAQLQAARRRRASARTRTRSRTRASTASCRSSSRSTTAASSRVASGWPAASTRCCRSTIAASCAPTPPSALDWFAGRARGRRRGVHRRARAALQRGEPRRRAAAGARRELRADERAATPASTTTRSAASACARETERDGRFRISTLADFDGAEVATEAATDHCTH